MRGKKYLQRKLNDGRPEKGAKVAPLKTKDILAEELNVSSRTIMNDAKFAQAVDTLSEFKNEICTGQTPRTKQELVLKEIEADS